MISTHVLDTSIGMPAENIEVKLFIKSQDQWILLASGKTNADGRFSFPIESKAGQYQLCFEVSSYFKSKNQEAFYELIPIQFKIENTSRKYHVPLLLNPFGFSTYRGS